MTIDLDKIADDLGLDRDKFRAGVQRIQREQKPVAVVDANDEGYWADILPDRDVKVGQQLFAHPAPQEAEKWQPIETAPKDGTDVLLFWGASDCEIAVGRWYAPKGYVEHWCKGGNWTPGDDPTHWMPLPAAPEEQQ